MRRMQGPPASLYAPVPTNATSIKSVDSTAGSIEFLAPANASPVALIIPKIGAGFFNRLGNRTRGISLHITGFVNPTLQNAAATQDSYARIIVYYDRQPNGANPSVSDLILATNNAGGVTTTTYDGTNMNNRDRFMILRDRRMYMPPLGINGATPAAQQGVFVDPNIANHSFQYNEYIKLKNLESLYNSVNGGTIGDISSGAYGILLLSQNETAVPAAHAAWQLTFNVRMKFLD